MGKYGRKIISALLMAVMLMGVAAIPAKAGGGEDAQIVYDKNSLRMYFERLGTLDTSMDKATPLRSGGPDGKAQLDSLTLYEQSTYAQKEPGRFYYRTVGYKVALLNGDFLNISDGLVPVNEKKIPLPGGLVYFPGKGKLDFQFALVNTQYERTKEFREESNANIKGFLKEKYQDAGFNTPCVSSIVLSRDYLIKALGIENNPGLLDEARYLLRCGEVEFFQADANGDEGPALDATGTKIYYNVFDRRFSTEAHVPPRFKDCEKDVQSRMQIIDLNSGEIFIIGEEVNLKVENGWADISKGDKLNIGADVILENNPLKKENGELPVKVILDWETKDGQKGHKETFINKIDVGKAVPVDFKDSVKIPEGGKLEGTYKIVVNPDNEHPKELNFSDNTFEGTFSVEDGLDFSVRARANFIPVDSEDTGADIEVEVMLRDSSDKQSTRVILYDGGGKKVSEKSISLSEGASEIISFTVSGLKEGDNDYRVVVNSDYNLTKASPVEGERDLSNNSDDIIVSREEKLVFNKGACSNGGTTSSRNYSERVCYTDEDGVQHCRCETAGTVWAGRQAEVSFNEVVMASDTWSNDINGQRAYPGMPGAKNLKGGAAVDELLAKYGINPLKQVIRAGHGFEVKAVLTLKGSEESLGSASSDYKRLYENIKSSIFVSSDKGKNNEGKSIQEMEYDASRAGSSDLKVSSSSRTYGRSSECTQVTKYTTFFEYRIPVIIKYAQGYINVLGSSDKVKVPNQRKWFTYLNDPNGVYQMKVTARIDWSKFGLSGVTDCSYEKDDLKYAIYGTMFDLVNIDDGGSFWDN